MNLQYATPDTIGVRIYTGLPGTDERRHLSAVTPPQRHPPKIRNCPFCRIAMVASRLNSRSTGFDQYQCLKCGTVIRFDGNGATDRVESGDNDSA